MIDLVFTGQRIVSPFGDDIEATCVVRNELNGRRMGPGNVLYELGGSPTSKNREGAKPYQPRPFPCGRWQIGEVVWEDDDSIYAPVFIRTNAHQMLNYWELDEDGHYLRKLTHKVGGEDVEWRFDGKGYGIHHARFGSPPIPSSTTLGCINILNPDNAKWLGMHLREAMHEREHVFITVPSWEVWEK